MNDTADSLALDQPGPYPGSSGDHYFSTRRLLRDAAGILFLLLVTKLGIPGNLLCFAILTVLALRSATGALMALSMTALLIISSEVLVTRSGVFSMLKFWILLVAGLTLLRESRSLFHLPEQSTLLLFAVIAAVLTLINGYFVNISLLKNAMFTWGALCLLATSALPSDIAPRITEWTLSLILVVTGLSVMLWLAGGASGVFETQWGQRVAGFRGALSHPQTMGVVASLFAVYLTALYIFTLLHRKRLLLTGILVLLALTFLSGARTGLIGYFLATGTLLMVSSIRMGRLTESRTVARYKLRLMQAGLMAVLLAAIFELATGRISDRMGEFLNKDEGNVSSLTEAFKSSRSAQIEEAWRTFKSSPLTGIGFGTDNSPKWRRSASIFSASAEKGFLPTAILEETGLVGTTIFALFLLVLGYRLLMERQLVGLAMLLALLIFNMAEMMFFALGGLGLMGWTMIGIGLTIRRQSELVPAPSVESPPTAAPAAPWPPGQPVP